MPLISFLESQDVKILLIDQPPELPVGDKNAPKYFNHLGMKPERLKNQYLPRNSSDELSIVSELKAACANCSVIETKDVFLKDNNIWVIDGFNTLYIDDDHLSHEGALKAKELIKESIRTLL